MRQLLVTLQETYNGPIQRIYIHGANIVGKNGDSPVLDLNDVVDVGESSDSYNLFLPENQFDSANVKTLKRIIAWNGITTPAGLKSHLDLAANVYPAEVL